MPAYVVVGAEWHSEEALGAYASDVEGESDEYTGLLEIRKQGATCDLILVDGIDH